MKRYISIFIAFIMIAGCFSGCSPADSSNGPDSGKKDKLHIVTTIFPEYDWVMNILGDDAANEDVTLLLNNGVDLHSFQPTAADILKISTCDLFIYVGGESDQWVEDVLDNAANKDMIVINLLDVLGNQAREEELAPGMQGEEEDGPVYDEHVWLSLRNAIVFVKAIAEVLASMDEEHAGDYSTNAATYIEKLAALDEEYKEVIAGAKVKTLLFGDRFPFLYMVNDYGLSYFAAFAGCSAETEASFETISFLAKKLDELSLHCVLTIDGSDQRIAETIIQNTKTKDQKILTLDAMQGTTSEDINNGASYLSIMEHNLEILKSALE